MLQAACRPHTNRSRTRRIGGAVLTAVVALSSQADNVSPREPGKILWATPLGTPYVDSSPAVARDGTIYFGAWNGRLFALRPDGKSKWVFRAGREIKSSPAIAADGTIYFGSRDRKFYAVTPRGKLKWSFPTGGWVDSSPAIATNGIVYFGSWDKKFYALTPDGQKRWEFATEGPVTSSPAVGADGTIYFGSHDKQLYALTVDGQKQWACQTAGEIISSPAIGPDGTIVFTSVDGKLYALRPDGILKWQLWTGSVSESSPVIDAGGAICLGVSNKIFRVTPDGKEKWEIKISIKPGDSTPVFTSGDTVRVVSEDGILWSYTHDAVWQWNIGLGGGARSSPTVVPDGTIYVGGWTWKLHAISGTNSLAKSSWPMFRCNARHTGNVADEQ